MKIIGFVCRKNIVPSKIVKRQRLCNDVPADQLSFDKPSKRIKMTDENKAAIAAFEADKHRMDKYVCQFLG